jgi:choline dehydrogenase-like flavoprotein
MQYDYDLIVVGSGAGGATLAYACAREGKRVLLVERGRKFELPGGTHDEQAMLIDKQPYDDRAVAMNGTVKRPYVGGVLGGGTSLFGAVLLRPSRDDFHPGKNYGRLLPRAIWDWPIAYDDLEPHYDEAERLYRVAGDHAQDVTPLQKPRQPYPQAGLPLHQVNQRLIAANRARGLRPFQLPLAIDSDRCLRCGPCAGYICPTGARRSSAHLLDAATACGSPLAVHSNVEVERLLRAGNGQVAGIQLRDRATGRRLERRARGYVLAAGAIWTPWLLMRSGICPPLLGRHYMFHLSPIVGGVFSAAGGADDSFVKQVGFADYYHGTKSFPHKLGIVQSLPVPGPLLLSKQAPLVPRPLLHLLRKRLLPLAGIVEDLPDPANRVECNDDARPRIHHRFAAYDQERGRQLGRLMARILRRAGARLCLTQCFPSDEHVAHQCGTLRFGTDPKHAVLDRDCRLFGYPNVFAVDGSFLPTSLGVGPALTIMANALRVASVLVREL